MKKYISILLILALLGTICIPAVLTAADSVVLPYEDVQIENGLLTCVNKKLATTEDTTLIIPASYEVDGQTIQVTGIADKGFSGRASVKGPVVISEGITSIGVSAFQSCSNMKRFSIPSTVTTIGDQAFQGAVEVEEYIVTGGNSFKAQDGVLYTADGKELVAYPISKAETSFIVPEGVEIIRAGAMRSANDFTEAALNYIVYPTTLKKICKSGTFSFTNLQTVVFTGASAPSIEGVNFNNSNSIKTAYTVYYPEGAAGYTATSFTKFFEEGSVYLTYPAGQIPPPSEVTPPPYTPTATPGESSGPVETPKPTNTPKPATPTPTVPAATEEPIPVENPTLYINEVCSSNKTGITDQFGVREDWIEIYNASDGYANLEGYGLSDSGSNLMKYIFPKVYIPAGGYLVVFTATLNNAGPNDVYGNFGISKSGETIYLTKPDGFEMIDSLAVPALKDDQVYGRIPDGDANAKILSATPGESNNNAAILDALVEPPVFSAESGFYGEEFQLNITSPSGLTIYYTTDGSEPDPANTAAVTYTTDHNQFQKNDIGTNTFTIQTAPYTGPFSVRGRSDDENVYSSLIKGCLLRGFYVPSVKVDKCMVVRAVTQDAEGNLSKVVTKSYFVGPEYSNLQEKYNGAPILSLVTDPKNLYDYDKGIFVLGAKYYDDYLVNGGSESTVGQQVVSNYNQRGREWEREAHLDFFEGDGTLGFSQEVGIRVRGKLSRYYNQRSLNVYARGDYGKSTFDYALIPGLTVSEEDKTPVTEYKSFMLRNGGNHTEGVKFHDPLIQSLISDRHAVATQGYRPAIVFIDGEYWGPYCLQERFSEEYVETHYGVPADNVVLSDDEEATELSPNNINLLIKYSDVRNDADYQAVCEQLDIENAIDYLFIQTYICNADWPHNNLVAWWSNTKTDRPYEDGKFRYMLFDTDQALADPKADKFTSSSSPMSKAIPFGWIQSNPKYGPGLLANMDFREQFIVTAMDLINVNMNPDTVCAKIDEADRAMGPLMPGYFERFGMKTVADYNNTLALRKNFFRERPANYISHLKTNFELGDVVDVTVQTNDSSMGSIQLNTVTPPLDDNTWTGQYFTDYPITLTAQPNGGYIFTGWETAGGAAVDNADSETISVTLSEAATLTAKFEKKPSGREETGEADDPFQIRTADDLLWMADMLAEDSATYGTKYYVLANDIELPAQENNVKAIGTVTAPFNGSFDGQYHTIKGLWINNPVQGQGLFGYVGPQGTVKNVGVVDCTITGGGKNVGAVVGNNQGLLENCYSTGTLEGASTVGGIAGNNTGVLIDGTGGTIRNCFSICTNNGVSASTAGGIAGKTEFYGTVENCYSLIVPVPKVVDQGTVDTLTASKSAEEFRNGTVTGLLNSDGSTWVQGTGYPVFSQGEDPVDIKIHLTQEKVTITSKEALNEVKLLVASYQDGKMVDLRIYPVSGTDIEQQIPQDFILGEELKAMLWTDLEEGVTPVTYYASLTI